MDPNDRVDEWQRDNDPEPPRKWGNELPFLAEAVPADVDEYNQMLAAGVDRDLAAAMMDASFMSFPEWRRHHPAAV